ncbi:MULTISPECIES: heavy metal transporter [Oerskovia]|uniref:Heavy metal transporter n=1 Tax=Oerskovia gallyi TaxID=2762226 RepID=A0ABR8V4G3_9CELL|nr:heavy metal transporter [Oerskovia gallyi]MBD7999686.1 heavy metal transporter [Oerskovia gallyi]
MSSQELPPRVVVRSTDPLPPGPSDAPPGAPDAGEEAPSGAVREGPGDTPGPDGGSEPAAVYARSLARTQLRLALACVVSFLAVVTLLTVTMSAVPTLGDVHVLGVPLPWLLHAYGFYPVIGAFALVFALAAARNERRFRALVDDE